MGDEGRWKEEKGGGGVSPGPENKMQEIKEGDLVDVREFDA